MNNKSISGLFLKTQLVQSEIRRLDRAIRDQEESAHSESALTNLAAMRMCRSALKAGVGQDESRRSPGGSLRLG